MVKPAWLLWVVGAERVEKPGGDIQQKRCPVVPLVEKPSGMDNHCWMYHILFTFLYISLRLF